MIAKEKGNRLTEGALERLRDAFEEACHRPDFGNGRYARNLIEQAKMEQANRLVAMDSGNVTREMLLTLEERDIIVLKEDNRRMRKIGFAS